MIEAQVVAPDRHVLVNRSEMKVAHQKLSRECLEGWLMHLRLTLPVRHMVCRTPLIRSKKAQEMKGDRC